MKRQDKLDLMKQENIVKAFRESLKLLKEFIDNDECKYITGPVHCDSGEKILTYCEVHGFLPPCVNEIAKEFLVRYGGDK
jgi:hypothetical protein